MSTHALVLSRANITAPDPDLADLEVPVLAGPQRQGDIGIWPRPQLGAAERSDFTAVQPAGVTVVRGEATGNTHLLMPEAGNTVLWRASSPIGADVTLGVLHVPDGSVAWLIHTDEHGVNGIGPGTYRLTGKREMAEELRRVAD
jgi:hypothetical protein